MGVKGLLTHCLNNVEQCADKVDLIEIARERNGILILVDYYSFQQTLTENFVQSVSQVSDNWYIKYSGGEYASLDAYISKFIKDLKSLGIEFKFYIDGSKGSSASMTAQKLETWRSRHKQETHRLRKIMDMCRGMIPVHELSQDTRLRPVLLDVQVQTTLKKCGCEVHQLAMGEADYVLAKELQDNERAYAILSNDSDFTVFPHGAMLCSQIFDLRDDLQLGQPVMVPEKPVRLMCHVLKAEKVAQSFAFSDASQMVELSIIGGNDFTGPFLRDGQMYREMGLTFERYPKLEQLAEFVHDHGRVEDNPVFAAAMERNRELSRAVEHTRKFYNLTSSPDMACSHGFLHTLICERIEQGNLSPSIIGLHNAFYWRRMMVEDNSRNSPSSDIAMIDLRRYVYKMVLPKHKHEVTEHGRSPDRDYEYARIPACDDKVAIPMNYIKQQEIFGNLRTFDRIMSHYEPNAFKKTWFDRYGRKNGFLCYVLRYFLVLNWGYNLFITECEFLAMLAVVVGRDRCDVKRYQSIVLRPSPRCVTLANWFQNVYRHAYTYLGTLLYLTHEFPVPSEVFSGSVWTAFYACTSAQAWDEALRQVPQHLLMQSQRDMDAVIKEKRHMIRYLTEHVFEFDDRY